MQAVVEERMRTKVTHIGFQAEVKGGAAEAAPAKDAPKGVAGTVCYRTTRGTEPTLDSIPWGYGTHVGTPPVLVEDLIAYGVLP